MSIGSGNGEDVDAQAAAWAVRSAERPLTESEQQQLDEWLAASSRHLGAYVRAQALWVDVDRVAALDENAKADPPILPTRWRSYLVAASLVAALIGGGTVASRMTGRVATERAEIRELTLPDGSTAVLNGDTIVQVRFSDSERRVVLRQGEVSLRVRHDAARPFLVTADDISVRAVGTEFSEAMEDEQVDVIVADGAVQVADRDNPGELRTVRANEQFVEASTGARRVQLDPAEVERRLAWRRGMLGFNGQQLGRAAEQVNRYSDIRVVIDDPTLARAEFLGVFRVGDARAFATAAARAFNGRMVEREDGLHIVRVANAPSH